MILRGGDGQGKSGRVGRVQQWGKEPGECRPGGQVYLGCGEDYRVKY
jgi:hypothetical protein